MQLVIFLFCLICLIFSIPLVSSQALHALEYIVQVMDHTDILSLSKKYHLIVKQKIPEMKNYYVLIPAVLDVNEPSSDPEDETVQKLRDEREVLWCEKKLRKRLRYGPPKITHREEDEKEEL